MSTFSFICPFCEQKLECPEDIHCMEIECPVCKNKIVPVKDPDFGISETKINSEMLCNQVMRKKTEEKLLDAKAENITEKEIVSFDSALEDMKTQKEPKNIKNNVNTQNNILHKTANYILAGCALFMCVLLLCKEYDILPKKCIKSEPQVYIEAQRDMLKLLALLKQNFPAKMDFSTFKKFFSRKELLDYSSQVYMIYAQQYLRCKGECLHHKKKKQILDDAFRNLNLLECKWVLCQFSYNKFKNAGGILNELYSDPQDVVEETQKEQEKLPKDIQRLQLELTELQRNHINIIKTKQKKIQQIKNEIGLLWKNVSSINKSRTEYEKELYSIQRYRAEKETLILRTKIKKIEEEIEKRQYRVKFIPREIQAIQEKIKKNKRIIETGEEFIKQLKIVWEFSKESKKHIDYAILAINDIEALEKKEKYKDR